MLIGHQKQFDELTSLAAHGNLHHAYLFVGPKSIGKTKFALELAAHVQGATTPVDKRKIMEGVDADSFVYLDEGTGLSIDTVRSISKRANESHYRPYLVFVIENIARMSVPAMNALLKTLEEPPEGTLFMMSCEHEESVLETLRSRCHVLRFHSVPSADMKDLCGDHVFASDLLAYSLGRPGKLKRLIAESDYFEAHQKMSQDLQGFLKKPTEHLAFQLSRNYEKSELLPELLDLLLRAVREDMLKSMDPSKSLIAEQLEACKDGLKANLNKKLLLDTLFLSFLT